MIRRSKESRVDPNYYLIINMFALLVMFTNPMLLLEASNGYCRSPRVDVPFIFVYFFDMIDCWSVQVSCLHYISRGVSSTLSMRVTSKREIEKDYMKHTLASQNQMVCVRREANFCSICYAQVHG